VGEDNDQHIDEEEPEYEYYDEEDPDIGTEIKDIID
jgi:hypothetical protein